MKLWSSFARWGAALVAVGMLWTPLARDELAAVIGVALQQYLRLHRGRLLRDDFRLQPEDLHREHLQFERRSRPAGRLYALHDRIVDLCQGRAFDPRDRL